MHDRKLVGSRQRSLSSRFSLSRRERPLLAGKPKLRLICSLYLPMLCYMTRTVSMGICFIIVDD